MTAFDQMQCPECGGVAVADFVDNGVGMQRVSDYACGRCGWIGDALRTPILEDPCRDGCRYAKDVGMFPYHSCGDGCMYLKKGAP